MAIYSGFSHEKLWFSIAMLVYQRVSDPRFWTMAHHAHNYVPWRSLTVNNDITKPIESHPKSQLDNGFFMTWIFGGCALRLPCHATCSCQQHQGSSRDGSWAFLTSPETVSWPPKVRLVEVPGRPSPNQFMISRKALGIHVCTPFLWSLLLLYLFLSVLNCDSLYLSPSPSRRVQQS